MVTQQCFTFRDRKRPKGRRPRKKRGGTEGRRFGPHPVPLVLTNVTTIHTHNCVLGAMSAGEHAL